MSENKKNKKRAHLNDFKLNDNNEYEYRGDKYYLDLDEDNKKKVLFKLLITYVLLVLFALMAGLLPFKGMMNTFYIIVPYVVEFIVTVILVPVIYNVYKNNEFRAYQYEKTVERIKPYNGIIMVDSLIGLIGSIVFIYLNGYEPLLVTVLFLLSKLMTFVLSRRMIKIRDLMVYKKV